MTNRPVDRANNDLSRFQFSCPVWWRNFCEGRAAERSRAITEHADWRQADWQRGRIGEVA